MQFSDGRGQYSSEDPGSVGKGAHSSDLAAIASPIECLPSLHERYSINDCRSES